MSRNCFNFNIPDNKRASKTEVIHMLTSIVGESLASKFADNMPKPAVTLMDEYRIENGKEWHNGK